jgi:hypothetical protein
VVIRGLRRVAAQSLWSFPGRGATVPFTEVEAEDAATNGTVIGPDRVYTRLPSEASGRRAVTLDGAGKYVEFTVPKAANAVSVRYTVPDSSNGTGLTTPVDLIVNGSKLKADGSTFTTLAGSRGVTFDPSSGNTATVTFTAASTRYVRVEITANTGWPAGRLSEFEVYSS